MWVRLPLGVPVNGSVVQSGRTLVSKTKCRRFKSFPGRHITRPYSFNIVDAVGFFLIGLWWNGYHLCLRNRGCGFDSCKTGQCNFSWCGHSGGLKSHWIRFDPWRLHQVSLLHRFEPCSKSRLKISLDSLNGKTATIFLFPDSVVVTQQTLTLLL